MKLRDQIFRQPCYVAFGQAMQGGGITSVDLAATRNPTTVILTASDGSAAPIAGADVSAAGVMTATDKTRLDSLSSPTTQDYPDCAGVASANIDDGVTHVRTASYATPSDGGGGLYRRVALAPTHLLQMQSADGAYWELVPLGGSVNVCQAGAVGDGITDDYQAFLDATQAFPSNVSANNQSSVRVVVPAGNFFIGSTLNIHASMILEGQSVGAVSGASVLIWPSDTAGIVVQRFNTTGTTTESPNDPDTKGSDGTIIRNLSLEGSGSFGAAADGIWLRARATIDQCIINGFSRDGIHIEASAGGSVEGNANSWSIQNCRLISNKRNGLFIDGADVNAGAAYSVDSSSNGRWGIFDSSFLGNTYVSCHCATNGVKVVAGNSGSSLVHYNGPENGNTNHRYAAKVLATESTLATTVPGTDENVWIEIDNLGVHSQIPTWLPGQPEGTYFHGGAFQTDNTSAHVVLLGCYTEGGQAPAQIVKPTQVLSGLHGAGVKGTGLHIDGNIIKLGNLEFAGRDDDAVTGMELDFRRFGNSLIFANIDGDHPSGTQFLAWDDLDKSWAFGKHANLAGRIGLKFTTDLTTKTFGRSTTPGPGYFFFPRGVFIGDSNGGRFINFLSAPPTSGAFARGDIILNKSPSASGTLGWTCVTAGTPGTWTELAIVSKTSWDDTQADIADLQMRVTALENPA